MATIAEKLTILADHGEGLLIRLYNCKMKYEGPQRPTFLTDPTLAKVVTALTKKFPEAVTDLEKVPGYEVFASKASSLFQELEPDYETFVDALEWHRLTRAVLNDITKALSGLQWESNPIVTAGYMDLVVKFLQVNMLASMINDRRTIVTAFARLCFIVKNSNENTFPKVARYIARYSDVFKKIPEVMKPLGKRIGQALLSLLQPFMKINDLQFLRKDGTLNIAQNPDKMALPSQDYMQLCFLQKEKMYLWIVFGYMFCPEELQENGAMQLIKMTLGSAYRTPLYRDITIPIHTIYDTVWKNFKSKTFKLGKERKIITEAMNASVTGEGADQHKFTRIYLRQSLANLVALFKDLPGLLAPKVTVVWSGLNAAKAEVLWYFRHIGASVPKTKDKFVIDNFRDKSISELLYLTSQLIQLIRQHQRIIQAYYLEYLQGTDYVDFEKQVNKQATTGDAGPILQDMLRELSGINVQSFVADSSMEYNFQALRLNWYRVEARLSATSSTITVNQVKDLAQRGRLIYIHSRNVDQIEEQIEEYASLKSLWYFRDLLLETFEKSIVEGQNALFCMSYLNLVSEFPENATPFLPEEREFIGPECVKLAQVLLEKVTDQAVKSLSEISKNYLAYNDQLKHENAAYPLLLRVKDHKFDKNFVPPIPPGEESQYKIRADLEGMRQTQRNLWQLCAAIQEFVDIAIYDHKFIPREFLRDKLATYMRSFIKQAVLVDTQNHVMQRPSVLETQLQMFFASVQLIENYVDLDIGELVREVCLKQCYNKSLSEVNKIDWTAEGELSWGTDVHLIKYMSKWYGEFVSKRLSTPGICYSANRKAFISRATMPFRAEEYSDLAELEALCRMIGPYGVKSIDREIMKFIVDNITGIRGVLRANKQALEQVAQHYQKDVAPQIKTLKDVDEFVNRSIAIGNALQFRALLHEAQKYTAEKDIPYIQRLIRMIFEQYPRNTFMKPEFLEMDALAFSVGLDVGTADQALKAILSKLIGEQDRALWKLLPFMYATSFICSKTWGEAQYHSTVEAHANNAHTMTLTINALLVAVESTWTEGDETEIIALLKKFVEVSSCILLRQAQQPFNATRKLGIESFPAIMIFMDKFIQDSPLLTQNVLEECMPYSLLRSMYKSLYEMSKEKGKKKDAQEDFHS